MATTPLYTLEEINAEIAAWKKCHLSLAEGKAYTVTTGGGSRSLTTHDIDEVWDTLQRLQGIRVQIETGRSGPQFLPGRPRR
jgi:hypothetical protein